MTLHGVDLDSERIRGFCGRWNITEQRVFGSIFREDFDATSEVDLLADFAEDEEWDLFDVRRREDELSAILGRRAEVLCRFAVECDANQLFRRHALSASENVYPLAGALNAVTGDGATITAVTLSP